MSSISIQTKKINELDEALAVGSDNDLLVLRLADGTGTKHGNGTRSGTTEQIASGNGGHKFSPHQVSVNDRFCGRLISVF